MDDQSRQIRKNVAASPIVARPKKPQKDNVLANTSGKDAQKAGSC